MFSWLTLGPPGMSLTAAAIEAHPDSTSAVAHR
jgi:hypothetical protein